jgi:hypothetical protein
MFMCPYIILILHLLSPISIYVPMQCSSQVKYVTLVLLRSASQSHVATDSQSVSVSWRRTPFGAHGQMFLILWQLLY